MLQFSEPIWLLAGAGVAVPLIIHLWNVKEERILKIGSISLWQEAANASTRSIRWTDIWLLILRCFLIILLSFFLAKPVWNEPAKRSGKGWILVRKNDLAKAYQQYKPLFDSLQVTGFEIHDFNTSFAELTLSDSTVTKHDSLHNKTVSYWSLLTLLDQKIPATFPVYLFADNQISHVTGKRPNLSASFHWMYLPPLDTAANWLQFAYKTNGDSLRLVKGRSKSNGTSFTYETLSRSEAEKVNGSGKEKVQLFRTGESDTQRRTTSLRIIIYSDGYDEDARYVKAAIEAIRDFTRADIQISVVKNSNEIPAKNDWIFWLSDSSFPALLSPTHVLIYGKGNEKNERSSFITGEEKNVWDEDIRIEKRIAASPGSLHGKLIWKDGFGNPILTLEQNRFHQYIFWSRFNLQWSNLVWSHAFPQVLFSLLLNEKIDSDENDLRLIDSSQIKPVITGEKKTATIQLPSADHDLTNVIWWVALVVFASERAISYTKRKTA